MRVFNGFISSIERGDLKRTITHSAMFSVYKNPISPNNRVLLSNLGMEAAKYLLYILKYVRVTSWSIDCFVPYNLFPEAEIGCKVS